MAPERFVFQQHAVTMTAGRVLNVGANEDPAGLKAMAPERVINCDIEVDDSYLDHRPNKVDYLFNAAEGKWPFPDSSATLVVLGDIIEHLYENETEHVFKEARRVAHMLCVTTPRDSRWQDDGVQQSETGYRTHCIEWTEQKLRTLLSFTGWKVSTWRTINYDFVPEGYLILAERDS